MQAGSTLNMTVPGPDDLHSGAIRTVPVTVAAGTYQRGEVLGIIGSGYGKAAADAPAGAVMPFDIVLAAPRELAVYTEGDFNEDALKLNARPLATIKAELRKVGILARKWGAAPDAA